MCRSMIRCSATRCARPNRSTARLFIGRGPTIRDEAHFERKLFVCRKVVSNRVLEVLGPKARAYYPVSVSSRTIVYKGLVLGKDLGAYYRDLAR